MEKKVSPHSVAVHAVLVEHIRTNGVTERIDHADIEIVDERFRGDVVAAEELDERIGPIENDAQVLGLRNDERDGPNPSRPKAPARP